MNSDQKDMLSVILTPGCHNLLSKLFFFSLSENWIETELTEEQLVAQKSIGIIKRKRELQYYHSLYHMLTCPFCLDQGYDILEPKSHKELWRIQENHPGEYICFLTEKNISDEKLRYFQILYSKLSSPKPGFWLSSTDGNTTQNQFIQVKAAGESEKLPPQIFLDNNISIVFERDPVTDFLNIGIIGGSSSFRLAIVLKVFFYNGEYLTFFGKDIAVGGMWTIKEKSRSEQICRVEINYS